MTAERKNGKKKAIVVVAIIIALLAVVSITVFACRMLFSNEQAEDEPKNDVAKVNEEVLARGFVEDKDTAENIVDSMKDKVADGMFACKMTMTWTFADGTSESPNAYVANSEANKYTFYFDVIQEETGEVLYSSALVPVGSSIQGITLNKDLDAGEYPLKVQYTLVDENYQEVSTVGFMITAIVDK